MLKYCRIPNLHFPTNSCKTGIAGWNIEMLTSYLNQQPQIGLADWHFEMLKYSLALNFLNSTSSRENAIFNWNIEILKWYFNQKLWIDLNHWNIEMLKYCWISTYIFQPTAVKLELLVEILKCWKMISTSNRKLVLLIEILKCWNIPLR